VDVCRHSTHVYHSRGWQVLVLGPAVTVGQHMLLGCLCDGSLAAAKALCRRRAKGPPVLGTEDNTVARGPPRLRPMSSVSGLGWR
jgi:hypothetical protein